MSNNTTVMHNMLRSLGYTGTTDDMELAFYQARGATSACLDDAEDQYLAVMGFATGATEDRWFAYMRSLGYTGAMPDMQASFWANFSDSGSFRLLTEAGDNILLENGVDFLRT